MLFVRETFVEGSTAELEAACRDLSPSTIAYADPSVSRSCPELTGLREDVPLEEKKRRAVALSFIAHLIARTGLGTSALTPVERANRLVAGVPLCLRSYLLIEGKSRIAHSNRVLLMGLIEDGKIGDHFSGAFTWSSDRDGHWSDISSALHDEGIRNFFELPGDWRLREAFRLYAPVASKSGYRQVAIPDDALLYQDTDDHFVHFSTNDPKLLSYTPDAIKGAADRQTPIKPGRYLKLIAPHLDAKKIETLAAQIMVKSAPTFKVAVTAEEIQAIYINSIGTGAGACMSYAASHFSRSHGIHPTHVYGNSDLHLAYLGTPEEPTARALIWPERKEYGRLYGDHAKLRAELKAAGYAQTSLFGAKIRKIKTSQSNHIFIMPYIDEIATYRDSGWGAGYVHFDSQHPEHFVLGKSPDPDQAQVECSSTTGGIEFRFPAPCPCCGVPTLRDLYTVHTTATASEMRCDRCLRTTANIASTRDLRVYYVRSNFKIIKYVIGIKSSSAGARPRYEFSECVDAAFELLALVKCGVTKKYFSNNCGRLIALDDGKLCHDSYFRVFGREESFYDYGLGRRVVQRSVPAKPKVKREKAVDVILEAEAEAILEASHADDDTEENDFQDAVDALLPDQPVAPSPQWVPGTAAINSPAAAAQTIAVTTGSSQAITWTDFRRTG